MGLGNRADDSELSESVDSDATTRPIRSEVQESTTGHYFTNPEESQMTDQPPNDLHIEVPLDDDQRDSPLVRQTPAPIYQSVAPDQSFHSYLPQQPWPQDALPRPVSAPPLASMSHDSLWAALYGLAMAGMFATSFMIWIGTETPGEIPLKDTIYSTLHTAFPLLISDGLLAIGIAILWLILMKHALQPFVYLLLFSVPISMFTLFLIPLVQSYRGQWGGDSFQDKAMRWGSIVPALIGAWWTYKMWKERHNLGRAVSIISLSGKIVRENQALIPFSFSVLGAFIAFLFVWILMFSRLFLRNYNGSMS